MTVRNPNIFFVGCVGTMPNSIRRVVSPHLVPKSGCVWDTGMCDVDEKELVYLIRYGCRLFLFVGPNAEFLHDYTDELVAIHEVDRGTRIFRDTRWIASIGLEEGIQEIIGLVAGDVVDHDIESLVVIGRRGDPKVSGGAEGVGCEWHQLRLQVL